MIFQIEKKLNYLLSEKKLTGENDKHKNLLVWPKDSPGPEHCRSTLLAG